MFITFQRFPFRNQMKSTVSSSDLTFRGTRGGVFVRDVGDLLPLLGLVLDVILLQLSGRARLLTPPNEPSVEAEAYNLT